ncbi:Mismatch repair endonuclease pms2 [Modicella reniformis]|uniref:Mismatch repair endonuclease pms2 n=1 Tax=Modicella reniformis TaxID=1440133 RepID=A0A9P6J4T3_9FUNG|nr:Mismatch repair endonuclease pms2 [Modicella reniformis]
MQAAKQQQSADEDEGDEFDQSCTKGPRRSGRLRNRQKLSDASFANMDNASAQKSLSRNIFKEDFARMKILGQFNNAFIIAQLDSYTAPAAVQPFKNLKGQEDEDRLSSDQHASDEKYNFETLRAKTILARQPLVQPKKLYLTAQEETKVVEHMNMLNKNGFYLDYKPEAPVSHRFKLMTLPVSESVIFDVQDFEELVFLLSEQTALSSSNEDNNESTQASDDAHQHTHHQNGGGGETKIISSPGKMARCSKVRALFASRACSRSEMP